MRPKYDPKNTPKMIKFMARSGLTNEQIAKELGVSTSTLAAWNRIHGEVSRALKGSRDFVDYLVEDGLLKRALGYGTSETKVIADKDGNPKRTEVTRKTVAPDVTACIFWLKNRRPSKWRDIHKLEHAGVDVKPTQPETKTLNDVIGDDDELRRMTEQLAIAYGAAQARSRDVNQAGDGDADPDPVATN